jgi:uncharacterized protein (DUF983 family)
MDGRFRKTRELNYPDHDRQDDLDPHKELRAGDLCPACEQGWLDYDGMLNLSCEECGFSLAGCFT